MTVFYGLCGHCCRALKAPSKNSFCRECNRKSARRMILEDIADSKILPERDKNDGVSRTASVAKRCKVIEEDEKIFISLISLYGGRNQVRRVITDLVDGDFETAKQIALSASYKLGSMPAAEAFSVSVREVLKKGKAK